MAKTGSSVSTRARGRSKTTRGKSQQNGGAGFDSVWFDVLLLVSLAAGLFLSFAVFYPDFSRGAGHATHDFLMRMVGHGMWFIPPVVLLFPLTLLKSDWRKWLLRAWVWLLCLTLLTSLFGGVWSSGGILGDSTANLGREYLGGFYLVLLIIVALLVIGRLAGRSLIMPLLRGTYRGAVKTTAVAADYVEAVGEERKELRKQRKGELQKRKKAEKERKNASKLAEERERQREAVIAAELEAADAPEGESPLVYAANGELVSEPGHSAQDAQHLPDVVELPIADDAGAEDGFAAAIAAAGTDEELLEQTAADGVGDAELDVVTGEYPAELIGDEDDEGQLDLFPSTQAGYELPPLTLLKDAPRVAGEEEQLERRSRTIERTLANFKIDAQCINAVVGPRVTRYELKIGPGINVSKIHNLADNLALELAVKAVRIEAPIPGKSAVGIEVPNAVPELVTLRAILESRENQQSNHPLTVGLGRDIAGQSVVANVAKMPHVLVAGATGSGKSVCLNAIIISLLTRNAPDTLRLILIDPKRVEMTNYVDIPHLACPVVHDVHMAQSALKWAVAEMERRYKLLEAKRARNIAAYNEMAQPGERLPFIVIIVDELADLMMLAGQVIEKLICRIAQLSRAVGIHLVIATQRPDVKVITGTIKANIPSRVAFATVSQIDSRTILDGAGAEKLLGSGDMLFSPIGENVPLRVQGAFLSDEEIDTVVAQVRAQADPRYDESITAYADDDDASSGGEGSGGRDELFGEAREIVQSTGRASTSFLQRRLKIGYNRAARIMEELEDGGIVSEPDHAGNRKVL